MDRYKKFDQIFREYYPRLYYHAYSFLHHTENSRDVVNDTFEILWKNFSRHADHPQLSFYLYSIVRHKCLDLLRHHSVHERYLNKTHPPTNFQADYDYTDYDDKLEKIKRRIAALPPKTRTAFMLCHLDGYTYQEAAAELSVSVNTVKTLLRRAMKILREAFVEK